MIRDSDIINQWNLDPLLGERPRCDFLRFEDIRTEPATTRMVNLTAVLTAYRDGEDDPVYDTVFMTTAPSDTLERYEDIRDLLDTIMGYMITQKRGIAIPAAQIESEIRTGDINYLHNLVLEFEDEDVLREQWKAAVAKDVESIEENPLQVASMEVPGIILDDAAVVPIDDSPPETETPPVVAAAPIELKYPSEMTLAVATEYPVGITVCLPTHNVERYITRTLDSIRMQKGKYAVLIRDDWSIDGTVDKIKAYIDAYGLDWTVMDRDENVGVNYSRALLMQAAQTSHVLFIDDDDYFTVDTAIDTLSQYLDRDIINFHIESPRIMKLENIASGASPDRSIIESMLQFRFIGRPSFVYRRTLFDGFTWYRYQNYTEDYFMTYLLLLKEPKEHICEDILYHWSERYGSLSTQDGKNALNMESLWFYRKIMKEETFKSIWYKNNADHAITLLRGRI